MISGTRMKSARRTSCQAGRWPGAEKVKPYTCPASTGNHPTIDRNFMEGAFYVDVGGTYNVTSAIKAYFKVDNLFDHDPAPSPQTNTGLDVNPALYDTLGRTYRVGVRFNF